VGRTSMGKASWAAKYGEADVRAWRGWMLVWAPASKIMRMLFGAMFGMELGGLLSVSVHAYRAKRREDELTLSA
jgi:hypothetical protein